jgi:hypothetical protein
MHATIWAPPGRFFVNTPSAVAVDLGCAYTLEVDARGAGLLRVASGWVAFERAGREAFVPAGAICASRPAHGPGTPYFEDASPAFRDALEALDFEARVGDARRAALQVLVSEARRSDALTLWHLLSRVVPEERALVFDRLSALIPPPAAVARSAIVAGDSAAIDLYWDALGFGNTEWWRMWKGPWPGRSR